MKPAPRTSQIPITGLRELPAVAVIADAHFHDIDSDYDFCATPFNGKYGTLRSWTDTRRASRVFNESGAALNTALDDIRQRGIRHVVLLGDYTDDGQVEATQRLASLLRKHRDKHGLHFYAIAGNSSDILTSPDFLTWTPRSTGAAEGTDEGREWVLVFVGEVRAVVGLEFAVGEVEGVCLFAAAHGDVDPFAVYAVVDDCVGTLDGCALGFVAGECVSPVEVSFVEVPVRYGDRLVVTVELEGHSASFGVDAGDGCEIGNSDDRPSLEGIVMCDRSCRYHQSLP